jgi:hypothetical protein
MPKELVDFGLQHGCLPIGDYFFQRPGMVDPPYAYGWLPGDRENSAVFWCTKEPNATTYQLMFKVRDPKQMAGCPTKIEWRNPPAGLSIEVRPSLNLDLFHDVNDSHLSRPTGVIQNARVIVNYYDGLTDVLYCYKGRWLVSRCWRESRRSVSASASTTNGSNSWRRKAIHKWGC